MSHISSADMSADHLPIDARHLSSADVLADDRPIVKFWD